MGLHLGWIPNEPGLRPRDFDRPAPTEPPPDPGKVAALAAAQHARGLWSRLLFAVGLMALVLFGFVAAVGHLTWCWAVGGGLAVCCWAAVVLLGVRRGRAARNLRLDKQQQAIAHAAELAEYADGKARWERAEVERIATAPRWLQVAAHEDITRLDVFGGTGAGRQNMVTGLGWELLAQRAVIVLDLTQDRVADGLFLAARRAGIGVQDYELPYDLKETPLLAGLTGEEIASLIVEVMHADDASATAAGRATDLMILKKIIGVLSTGKHGTGEHGTRKAGDGITMGRLHCALTVLLGDGTAHGAPYGSLARGEEMSLGALFSDSFRQQVTPNLVRLAAVVEPLTALGAGVTPREPARLTCLSLAEGPRDVTADLTAALVVQWVTRAISASGTAANGGERGDGAAFGDTSPAVILAGADEQSTRHLGRLTAVCERHGIPLIRTFSRLTEESARHLDTRHTAFMRLATRPEALRAAEHIGLERRFVAGRFSHSRSVSRSRTKTSSESFTHTSGRTEGEATTHTTGTISGQAHSEAEVPRHDQDVHVHVEDHRPQSDASPRGDRQGDRRADDLDHRLRSVEREQASRGPSGERTSSPRPRDRGRSGGGSGGFGGQKRKRTPSARVGKASQRGNGQGKRAGKPQTDIVKTKTWFTAQHESDSKTKSWSTTQEDSHTVTTSRSRTDGVSAGDEISYELVYDHKVHPETLMVLPEEQMLAPHIVEAPAVESKQPAVEGNQPMAGDPMVRGPVVRGPAVEGKMVALVIDPAVVGTEAVAPVRPHEIPAFEPPAPAISRQVPDYERVAKPAGGSGPG